VLVALCSILTCGVAFAKDAKSATADYPVAAVHLIVTLPSGGGADYWGRLVATRLAVELGQSVIVDNIPGAGGNKGTAAATAASPDGYTLLLGLHRTARGSPYTYATLAFNPRKGFCSDRTAGVFANPARCLSHCAGLIGDGVDWVGPRQSRGAVLCHRTGMAARSRWRVNFQEAAAARYSSFALTTARDLRGRRFWRPGWTDV